jgi:hypothetical protein
MFMSMSLLYLDIGYAIHDKDWKRLPFTIVVLGVMLFFMYVFVTDILLSRQKRIEGYGKSKTIR